MLEEVVLGAGDCNGCEQALPPPQLMPPTCAVATGANPIDACTGVRATAAQTPIPPAGIALPPVNGQGGNAGMAWACTGVTLEAAAVALMG